MSDLARLAAGALATLVIALTACGGDNDDEATGREAANGNAPSGARDVDRFLMRAGEQPGFRPDGDAFTERGVDSFATGARLPRATVKQLRENEFISFTTRRTLGGRQAAGVSEVLVFATSQGLGTT